MCTRLYVYSIDLDPRLYVYASLCILYRFRPPSLCVPVSMCTRLYVYSSFLLSEWFAIFKKMIESFFFYLGIKLFV
jgi:hypothetical protein